MSDVFPLTQYLPTSSRMIFGCMGLGGTWDNQPITDEHIRHAEAAVEAALAIGINLFDHADIYTLGKAEKIFGILLKRNPELREHILIQSKCGIRFSTGMVPKRYDLSRNYIVQSVDGILSRLGIDYLDTLLLHRPDPLMNPDEIAEAWLILKQHGKVRHLGVSNMHSGQIRQLQSRLSEPLVANQLEMSLMQHDWIEQGTCFNNDQAKHNRIWGDTLEYCQTNHIQLQAWGSLAKGWFTGAAPQDASQAVLNTQELVSELARRYGVAGESIVLAWLMKHPAHIQPVIGTCNPLRIQACAGALQVELSRDEWYQLYVTVRGVELP